MIRCEGWERHGEAFTFGPVKWIQYEQEAVVMLTVIQDGETETLPSCMEHWKECIANKYI